MKISKSSAVSVMSALLFSEPNKREEANILIYFKEIRGMQQSRLLFPCRESRWRKLIDGFLRVFVGVGGEAQARKGRHVLAGLTVGFESLVLHWSRSKTSTVPVSHPWAISAKRFPRQNGSGFLHFVKSVGKMCTVLRKKLLREGCIVATTF